MVFCKNCVVSNQRPRPEFNDEDRDLKDEEIDWLLSNCYQVGLISSKDLVAMGKSIKKSLFFVSFKNVFISN